MPSSGTWFWIMSAIHKRHVFLDYVRHPQIKCLSQMLSLTICTVLDVSGATLTLLCTAAALDFITQMMELIFPNCRLTSVLDFSACNKSKILIFSCKVGTFPVLTFYRIYLCFLFSRPHSTNKREASLLPEGSCAHTHTQTS